MNGEIRNEIKGYGRIGTDFADDILSESPDTDVAGYYLELDSNRISHMKDHTEDDSDKRNIPLTVEQIENIPYYIENYDELLDVHKRKDGSVRVYIGKETANGNVVIVEMVSRGRNSLQPVTAWQNNKETYQLVWGQKKTANTSHALNNAESGYKAANGSIAPDAQKGKQKNSNRDITKDDTAEERAGREKSYAQLRSEIERLRKRVDYWKGQSRITREASISEKDVDKLARSLIREYESGASVESVRQKLRDLGNYLVRGERSATTGVSIGFTMTESGTEDGALNVPKKISSP